MASAQLTKREVESRSAFNVGFCLCQVHARTRAKKCLLKAPEQMAGADHTLCPSLWPPQPQNSSIP